jgi:hypothetical protein
VIVSCEKHARRLFTAAAFLLIALRADGATSDGPAVTFEERAIEIGNVTPSGEVVVFGIARDQLQVEAAHIAAYKFILRDANGTGRVRFTAGRPIDTRGVWAFVDVATGRTTVVPRGLAGNALVLPPGVVKHVKHLDKSRIGLALPLAELLVVRPGEGAWMSIIGDGGPADDDGLTNGVAACAPEAMKHVKSKETRKLDRIRKGDVVVVIDPVSLGWFASSGLGE